MKSKYIAITIGILIVIMIVVFGNVFLIKSIDVVFTRNPVDIDEASVISSSKIVLGSNIFSVDEKDAAKAISSHYPNNTLAVLDIERVFPNKVIIRVKERTPLLVVPYGDEGTEFVPTDIDFQMTAKVSAENIDFDAITVNGASVTHTFNTLAFKRIRETLLAFVELGFTEEGMIAFVESISLSAEKLRIELRRSNTVFDLSLSSDKPLFAQVNEAYTQFLDLPYDQRAAANISIE